MPQNKTAVRALNIVDFSWLKTQVEGAQKLLEEEGHAVISLPCGSISQQLQKQTEGLLPYDLFFFQFKDGRGTLEIHRPECQLNI